ncbi:MAG: methyltransferase domain-containing protein [Candidatus Zixiibacteriota bacterium]
MKSQRSNTSAGAKRRASSPGSNDWWLDFFPEFRPVFNIVDRRTTDAQVRYLVRKLNLRRGRSFLDCPCGIGRIALPLAAKGIRVTGVDITQMYLDEVAEKARQRRLPVTLLRSDMREIPFRGQFDTAGNLWTSFGYFPSVADDQKVLERMHRALRPGGRFVLHVINRDWIMAHFQARDWFVTGGMRVLEERRFDYAASQIHSVWTFIRDGKAATHKSTIRMYSYHELAAMMEEAGFIDVEGFGSMKDDPISRDTMMMFVFGTKPMKRSRGR